MKRSSIVNSVATLAAVAIWCSMGAPAVAQSKKLPPGAINDKKVQVGYGLDKDQPFAGADPDGTGLPFKEPPPAAVEAAKKAPTPHLADGHPDLTGFWGPAGGVTPSRKENSARTGRLTSRSARRTGPIRQQKRPLN